MQAQIPQELSALMALSQGMQQGRVATTTPDGDLTVAAQKVGEVEGMLPGMQQAVGQAGLGAQIKAMQMQEAQKAMMNAAMQQTRPPAGIERLNPQMGNFAEGGIVGYANGDLAEDEYDRRLLESERTGKFRQSILGRSRAKAPETMSSDERERMLEVIAAAAPMMPIPEVVVQEDRPAPTPTERQPSIARPSGGVGIEELANKQRAMIASMKGPPTPEEIMAQEQREAAIQDQYLRSKGLPTTAEMFAARGAEDKSLVDQQRALLRERMERESGRDTFLGRMGEALRGFRQMKGEGVGPGFGRSYEALSRRLAAGEVRMDQMRDFELKINELEINRRRALDDARRATAEGDWKRAQQRMGEATAFGNEIKKLTAATYPNQIQQMVELAKADAARDATRAVRENQEFARLQGIASTYETRKVDALRKLDEDFVKNNKFLLQQEQFLKDEMTPQQQQALQQAKDVHLANRAAVAQQFDDRLAMINSRLYPGVDFSVGRAAAPTMSRPPEGAVKMVKP